MDKKERERWTGGKERKIKRRMGDGDVERKGKERKGKDK